MPGRILRTLVIVAAALLLHLPAHFALPSFAGKQPLPEDGPGFSSIEALALRPGENVFDAARRAAVDPSSAWHDAVDTVGRDRWRPVATALYVLERAAPWAATPDAAVAGAAVVSLALHVLVALGAARLASALGAGPRTSTLAGVLVAACPVALAAAAWPARQSVVLAAALAVGGALVGIRGGALRLVASGGLIAAAGLAHEAAFGWLLALVPLRAAAASRPDASAGSSAAPRWYAAWPAAVLPAAALVLRLSVLAGTQGAAADPVPPDALRGPNVLDGMTGVLATFVSFAVPARLHFADGPFAFGFVAHAAALAALALAAWQLWRHRSRAPARAALAALVALAPLLLVGVAGGAPFQDSSLYLVLPLVAVATALALAAAALRGGAVRLGAIAAGAALVCASAASTATKAPKFRTRRGLVALALREQPQSPVARAWDLATRAGGDAAARSAVAHEVGALALEAGRRGAPRLRRDAVAAATLSAFFIDYAGSVRQSPLPRTDSAWTAAEFAAAAATELRPLSLRVWVDAARFMTSAGALRAAVEAATRAMALGPDNPSVAMHYAEAVLAVGNAREAADTLERMLAVVADRARAERREIEPDFLMAYARALAADGALRVPDPSASKGLRYRYDLAAEIVEGLKSRPSPPRDWRGVLYDIYLRYGDHLASPNVDRPAMARIAYQLAIDLTGGDMSQQAGEHFLWLADRLGKEQTVAAEHLKAAEQALATVKADTAERAALAGRVVDALVELYIALCRQMKWDQADELFAKLTKELGGTPPLLRYHQAVHRHAALENEESQTRAEEELRRVTREDPTIARAWFELARVLEWQGTVDRLEEARQLYLAAARRGVLEDWSLDAVERADALAEIIRRTR